MLFGFNKYSSLLLVFFIHGLVYAFLLFRKSAIRNTRSDKWLAVFLLLCILYITPWMVGFAGWYDTQPYRDILFYVPFQHLFFIGPVIYFYVQSLLNPSFRFGKKEKMHLIPGILYLVYTIVIMLTDRVVKKEYYFLANGEDPDFDRWYQLAGFASMLIYFFLSLRYYSLYRKFIVQVISYAGAVRFRWVSHFLQAFLLMLLVRFIFFIAGEFMQMGYWDTWWYFLLFAILFYYIAITGYANAVETKVAFKQQFLHPRTALLLPYDPQVADIATEKAELVLIEPVKTQVTDNSLLDEWKPRLLQLMEQEKIYEDPELSLLQVARHLQNSPSFVSMLINKGFGLNFNDFVNGFRIAAFKTMIQKGEQKRQTLLSLAFECGFNSKATFNRAFRKATGQSPKEYLDSHTRGNNSGDPGVHPNKN